MIVSLWHMTMLSVVKIRTYEHLFGARWFVNGAWHMHGNAVINKLDILTFTQIHSTLVFYVAHDKIPWDILTFI